MNINRNNYEEYFLLYADKELSVAEKNMVEMFVKENPDLEEEFVMLQQSVVKPDNYVTLGDKTFLMRAEGFIDESNYQEKFLLYTDNELAPPEIRETEKFILENPALQHEFRLLQKVTFEPDRTIVFPDKKLLYKKEEERRVIPLYWRYLAAAILLGVGLWTGIVFLQNKRTEPEMAVKPHVEKTDIVKQGDNDPHKREPVVQNKVDEKQQAEKIPSIDRNTITPAPKEMTVVKIPEDKKIIPENVDTSKAVIVKLDNNLPKPEYRIIEPADKKEADVQVMPENSNNYAMQASYIQDAELKSENYVFYNITSEQFKKSKVGNFLKKVKRTIERKIPLRNNSLKIGNVEIAKDDQN